jgi:hypothetical protein
MMISKPHAGIVFAKVSVMTPFLTASSADGVAQFNKTAEGDRRMMEQPPKGLYCYFVPRVRKINNIPYITKRLCPHLGLSGCQCCPNFCEKYLREVEDLCKCDECLSNDREVEE